MEKQLEAAILSRLIVELLQLQQQLETVDVDGVKDSAGAEVVFHEQQIQGVIKHNVDVVLTLFIPRGVATMGRQTLCKLQSLQILDRM